MASSIREKNQEATIITTPWDDLTGVQILGAMEKSVSLAEELMAEEDVCPVCGHHHDHDEEHEHHHHDHDHEEHEHHHHDHDHEEHEHHHHDHDHEEHEHHHDHDHEEHEHHHHDHDHEEHEHHHHDHEHHHHHHHADEVFTSWGKETARKYTKDEVEQILKTLTDSEEYGAVLRAKGMLPDVNGTWIYFDMVPGEYELREGQPDYTGRLCVIGSKLQEEKLAELFRL